MSVRREDVERIAELAYLALDAAETDRLTEEMNRILEHVDALSSLELVEHSDLSPQMRARLPDVRAAEAEEPDPLHASTDAFAPDLREGFFVVPPPPGLEQVDDS